MPELPGELLRRVLWIGIALGFLLIGQPAGKAESDEGSTLRVLVIDAETGKPISQAHLTLQFHESAGKRKFKKPLMISFAAKTNPQGQYKFTNIIKGTIRLMVTADHHESFGKDIEFDKDDQVIEVKLKKPQPLL